MLEINCIKHLFCDLYFSKNTFPKIQQKLGGQLEICISVCLLSATLLNGWTETLYSCSIRPEDVHEGGPNNFKGGIQYCGTVFFCDFISYSPSFNHICGLMNKSTLSSSWQSTLTSLKMYFFPFVRRQKQTFPCGET